MYYTWPENKRVQVKIIEIILLHATRAPPQLPTRVYARKRVY